MSHTSSEHASHGESGHGSVKSYIVGFILSIVLTIVAFGAVMQQWFVPVNTMFFIAGLAVLQLLVQLIMFLHLGSESKPYWNLSAFLFSVLIVFVVVVGSLWIMYNLNANMEM